MKCLARRSRIHESRLRISSGTRLGTTSKRWIVTRLSAERSAEGLLLAAELLRRSGMFRLPQSLMSLFESIPALAYTETMSFLKTPSTLRCRPVNIRPHLEPHRPVRRQQRAWPLRLVTDRGSRERFLCLRHDPATATYALIPLEARASWARTSRSRAPQNNLSRQRRRRAPDRRCRRGPMGYAVRPTAAHHRLLGHTGRHWRYASSA